MSGSVAGVLIASGLIGAMLLAIGHKDYPDLHTVLDTGIFLLSGALAALLWDIGGRLGRPFPKWLAIGFAVAGVLEFLHVMVTVEWSGPLAVIAEQENSCGRPRGRRRRMYCRSRLPCRFGGCAAAAAANSVVRLPWLDRKSVV